MSDQSLNLKFVKEVEKREILYNFNLPGYSRKDLVEKNWQEIADIVNLPISECKEKWRNVRTVFIRKMKPLPNGSRRRKAYYLADAMKFCIPYIKILAPPNFENYTQYDITQYDTNTTQNMVVKSERYDEYDDNSGSIEDLAEIYPPEEASEQNECPAKKQKLETPTTTTTQSEVVATTSSCNRIEQKEAIKMFLLSLIPEVENFSDSQMKQFKRRIFGVIDEISDT
ncbi:uncharacterized protein LOC129913764 [Episyrphus balteatus]|uniref:uncharacterized protein LOC129913764 n=1 Tax=Episyrphus balteatus TaxID=286459 RepID=UPI002486B907|nr:uncharacterized protein LOC129913764 [Episyrphus balteatus]